MSEPTTGALAEPVPGGDEPPPRPEAATAGGRRLRWWREALYVLLFYYVGYSQIRNLFGSNGEGSAAIAFDHAKAVIRVQEAIGLWFEPALQRWYLDLPAMGLIRFWNIYTARPTSSSPPSPWSGCTGASPTATRCGATRWPS